MAEYIVGLKEYAEKLKKRTSAGGWLDLREHPLEGVERSTATPTASRSRAAIRSSSTGWRCRSSRRCPWEAEKFFHQPGMEAEELHARLVAGRHRGLHADARTTRTRAWCSSAIRTSAASPIRPKASRATRRRACWPTPGKTMPFIDRVVFTREKESDPATGTSSCRATTTAPASAPTPSTRRCASRSRATPSLRRRWSERGIELRTSVAATIFYFGFNWSDPVVGGSSERARKLRQAISIAVDWEEYLSIFAERPRHRRAQPAGAGHLRLPRRARGRQPGHPRLARRPRAAAGRSSEAKKLLAEAGYPEGGTRRPAQPLVLYLDTTSRGPGDKARLDWWRKQFDKLSIQLEMRETDWNRFQEKIRKGTQQIYVLGWNADYPDPENFLFLLHGPQSARRRRQGENSSNYVEPRVRRAVRAHEEHAELPRAPEAHRPHGRDRAARRALDLAASTPRTTRCATGGSPTSSRTTWPTTPCKYLRVDPARRAALRREWNRPVLWPVVVLCACMVVSAVPAFVAYRRRERMAARPAA